MAVPDPRIKNQEPLEEKELRYPREILDETTDYLRINIVKYTPTGTTGGEGTGGTTKVGSLKIGEVEKQLNFTVDGRSYSYEDTEPNRKFAAKVQGLEEPITFGTGITPKKGNRYNNKVKSQTQSIILPIPSNIQDGNSVTYGGSGLDFFTAQALGIVQGAQYNAETQNIGTALINALKSTTGVLANSAVQDRFLQGLRVQAANLFGGNLTVSQLIARQTGQVLDPNMELFFEGVNLRSFKFSFKMTPRNEKEADNVKRIIRTFKRNMAPQVNDIFLDTPNIFELTYMKGKNAHPFLHKFKQCALTDMSVNYTGDGTYSTYGNGTPVSMIMDLSFKELEPIYAGDYDPQKDANGNIIREAPGGVGY